MKPHISCFTTSNAALVSGSELASRCDFGYAELFIEVKPSPAHDFFNDPAPDASAEARATHEFTSQFSDEEFTKRRDSAHGQHIAYVTEIFARQHRTFLFSISMSGPRARLLRWDRAGCVVTESFDIRSQPDILCEFLWRFSSLPPARRGHDPTVRVASPEEEQLFYSQVTDCVRYQLQVDGATLKQAVSEHYLPGNVAVVHVLQDGTAASAETIHRFIVSRPVVSPLNLCGRGTRGFWAVNARSGRVVFLKDTWRVYTPYEVEGDVLQQVNEKGVRNVPSLICHGDVPDYIPDGDREFTGTSSTTAPPLFC